MRCPEIGLLVLLSLLPGCPAGPGTSPFSTDSGPDLGRDVRDARVDVASDAAIDVVADSGAAADIVDATTPADADVGDAAADAGCTPVGEVPYADRNTNEEFTDPPTCSACPRMYADLDELAVSMLPPGDTTLRIAGAAPGATHCEWYVQGGPCGSIHGSAATDPDGAGSFSFTVPVFCGTNVVRLVCGNGAGRRVLVRRLQGTDCPHGGRDLRLTLTWDDQGSDMELHLLRARGRLNDAMDDCTWFNCIGGTGLDWGVTGDASDNPSKDVDNVGFFGPENIFLDRAPAGTYHVLVEYWATGNPSANDVDVTIRESTVARLHHAAFAVHHVWYVGTVTFPAGVFTPVDTDTDCTSPWRVTTHGCDLPLP